MKRCNFVARLGRAAALLIAGGALAMSASAATVDWTLWSTGVAGNPGSALGATSGGVAVTYAGEMEQLVPNYPSWTPASTFSGGNVGNPPPQSGGIIKLFGGGATVDSITFSAPVVNPVMAIWSLGQGGASASFVFNANEPFSIQSGGPSAEFGGSAITQSGNVVLGQEGNGTIEFSGTFSQLSWTNPNFENWYGFTVGIEGLATVVPEPETYAMLVAGLGLLRFAAQRKRARR